MTIIGRFYGYAELLTPKKEIFGNALLKDFAAAVEWAKEQRAKQLNLVGEVEAARLGYNGEWEVRFWL